MGLHRDFLLLVVVDEVEDEDGLGVVRVVVFGVVVVVVFEVAVVVAFGVVVVDVALGVIVAFAVGVALVGMVIAGGADCNTSGGAAAAAAWLVLVNRVVEGLTPETAGRGKDPATPEATTGIRRGGTTRVVDVETTVRACLAGGASTGECFGGRPRLRGVVVSLRGWPGFLRGRPRLAGYDDGCCCCCCCRGGSAESGRAPILRTVPLGIDLAATLRGRPKVAHLFMSTTMTGGGMDRVVSSAPSIPLVIMSSTSASTMSPMSPKSTEWSPSGAVVAFVDFDEMFPKSTTECGAFEWESEDFWVVSCDFAVDGLPWVDASAGVVVAVWVLVFVLVSLFVAFFISVDLSANTFGLGTCGDDGSGLVTCNDKASCCTVSPSGAAVSFVFFKDAKSKVFVLGAPEIHLWIFSVTFCCRDTMRGVFNIEGGGGVAARAGAAAVDAVDAVDVGGAIGAVVAAPCVVAAAVHASDTMAATVSAVSGGGTESIGSELGTALSPVSDDGEFPMFDDDDDWWWMDNRSNINIAAVCTQLL
jgi:hypothetical protein